jgi:hypothetical protein
MMVVELGEAAHASTRDATGKRAKMACFGPRMMSRYSFTGFFGRAQDTKATFTGTRLGMSPGANFTFLLTLGSNAHL